MPNKDRHRWLKLTVSYGLLLGAIVFTGAVAFHAVDSSHRVIVIRVAAGLFAGIVLIHLASWRRKNFFPEVPSNFELALVRQQPPTNLDPAFARWRDQLRLGVRHGNYFAQVTWPALLALADQLGFNNGEIAKLAPIRRRFRRGPSLQEISRIVKHLEQP